MAYTILDVATPISQEVAKNLKAINGVYRVQHSEVKKDCVANGTVVATGTANGEYVYAC